MGEARKRKLAGDTTIKGDKYKMLQLKSKLLFKWRGRWWKKAGEGDPLLRIKKSRRGK